MADSTDELVKIGAHPPLLRLILAGGVVALGLFAMGALGLFYVEPEVSEPPAPILRSAAVEVHPQDFRTLLRGFGTARSRVRLEVRPEVGGRIASLHPSLETGLVVPQGDILFTIEKADYEAALLEAEAEVLRLEAEIVRLRREEENDKRRLAVTEEQRELGRAEYERIASLFREGGAESQARLDQARSSLLQREDAVVALENSIALYPSRMMAAEAQLKTATARHSSAQRDLERTSVAAPFDARVTMKDVEIGKYVTAGQTVLRVSNDRLLEIPVSLESTEVSRWMSIESNPLDPHWFARLEDLPVGIRWAEQVESRAHAGRLDRVESYDPMTRTFTFVIQVDSGASDASPLESSFFPLTDGMFCHVEIPGRQAHGVYVVPREAVDSQGNILAVRNGRLSTLPVVVSRKQDSVALIESGLQPGEIVIISRPPNVLDGTLVEPSMVSLDLDGGRAL